MRIALLGSRGVPARYGGYETLMEQLGARLVERGHQVTVYCRSHYTERHEREHLGMDLVVLPTVPTKHLDTPVHTFLSTLHALPRRYDAALVVNAANAVFVPILRVAGIPTALHVDGLEQERAKWGTLGRWVYRASERLALAVPNRLITDAVSIQRHFEARHGKASTMIPYGSDLEPASGTDTLTQLGLSPGSYFLYVSRFEPENNPHRVVEAFHRSRASRQLVMLGDAPYASDFIRSFTSVDDPRILFPGARYGEAYRQLQTHAYAYIQATEVGGTHPALVEAMGFGNCILLNDVPEHREVAGDAAILFQAREPDSLVHAIDSIDEDAERARALGTAAHERAQSLYSWAAVTDAYERLFRELVRA